MAEEQSVIRVGGNPETEGVALPARVLITFIGDHFGAGVLEAAHAAAAELRRRGATAHVHVQKNICIIPHMGLEATRNFAIMRAREWRFDYLVLIEDDVRIDDPATIARLIERRVGIVSPYFDQTELVPQGAAFSHSVAYPPYAPHQGLLPVDWAVRSMVVFDCQVFDTIGERPFIDTPIYNTEAYHGLYFRRCGAQWWQDTDVAVTLLRYPKPAWTMDMTQVRGPSDTPWEELRAMERKYEDYYQQAQAAKRGQPGGPTA